MFDLPRVKFARVWTALVAIAILVSPNFVCAGQREDDGEKARVIGVRHWSLGDVTRIAVETTGEFRFKSDRLHSPERLFFDVIGARPQLQGQSSNGISYIAVGDAFVKQIRVAETQRGVTRVVLDLESSVEFSTSQLSNPDRLIVELHAAGSKRLDRFVTENRAPSDSEERRVRPYRAFHPDFPRTPVNLPVTAIAEPPTVADATLRYSTRYLGLPDPLVKMAWYQRRLSQPPPKLQANAKTVSAAASVMEAAASANPVGIASRPEEIALPAKRNSQADTMIRVLGLKLGRVVIDPGHGGHDAGTTGNEGLREKDVVLDVSRRLGELIQERLGSEVVYTRTDDSFVGLTRRTAIANEKKADLFLSIHVNSSPIRSVAGVETYYLNFTTVRSSLETASRENAGADKNVGELQDLLKKIALKDKAEESREFAAKVQNSLLAMSPKAARATRDRGVKRAPFVVLIGAAMPSILAEIGFISNSQEESLMRRPEHRQKLAEALYNGLASYANSLSHFQVAEQQTSRFVAKPAAPE